MTDRNRLAPAMGQGIRLGVVPTDDTLGFAGEDEAQADLEGTAERLAQAQDVLMAHGTHGLLLLLQGMDASGKDETITFALSSLDMRACEFKQFQKMTEKEARHDYLWRVSAALPARGQVGVFDRSYYEHVVSERVHPEKLEDQRLPPEAAESLWEDRCRQINEFERYLTENGIHVLKVFLHVSKEEQRKRLLRRIERPETRWQFSRSDIEDRELWDEFMDAYSEALTRTHTEHALWHVVPADREWCARAAIASLLADRLEALHDDYPELTDEQSAMLEEARRCLEAEAPE